MGWFWLVTAYLLVTLWLPLGLATAAWSWWSAGRSRVTRTLAAIVFWLLVAYLLGWLFQYLYRTHIWFMWDQQWRGI